MDMIRQFGGEIPGLRHLLVGCQNLYDGKHYGEIAQDYYRSLGQDVISVDITGCNNSMIHDLTKPLEMDKFDFISQHGTLEHVDTKEGFYLANKHLHDILKTGGTIIHENPKTGNWKGHGYHYYTKDFYRGLVEAQEYELLELGEHAAMGNVTDGWNVFCVLRKLSDTFISKEQFNKLDIRNE